MNILIVALDKLLWVIQIALVIRAILSWIPNLPRDNPFIVLLDQITEPMLSPIRRMIERSSFGRNSMLDLSPLILYLLIEAVRRILFDILRGLL